jgi:hypothetical protein
MTSLLNIAGNIPVSAAVGGQSLRFEDGDSAYLSFTPASAGNRKTWTWSGWVKRGNLTTTHNTLFMGRSSPVSNAVGIVDNQVRFYSYNGSGFDFQKKSSAVLRDPSAWYHIVAVFDSSNATAADRAKIYINGERITSFASSSDPSLNFDGQISNNVQQTLGQDGTGSEIFDGYLANVTFIDGQALTPTSFGEYDDTLWKPKSDTDIQALTFGTNGFYLPFKQTTEAEGFSTVTYTGNGGTQSIEGVGFEPDFVWIKQRNNVEAHALYDSVRGVGNALFSNGTNAETYNAGYLTSFDSNGFSVGSANMSNENNINLVAWCWDAGTGSAVSNTDGSITSSVKANTANGFSIVSYTGTGANATIGHGLSSAPEMIIFKERNASDNWSVYHTSIGNTYKLRLNGTNAQIGPSANLFNSTSPTATVFSTGTDGELNGQMIAYCFHSVSGYSSIGSYTGNGSTTGPTVTTGFPVAFVLIKRTDVTDNWIIYDTTRSPVNPADKGLFPNDSSQELTGNDIDFNASNFQIKTSDNGFNASGGTYIYMAFKDTRDATFFGDTSGNGNNWTPNALNNTDVVPDSPVTGGNFAVLNPLATSTATFKEGNLFADLSVNSGAASGTIAADSGKWYWEVVGNSYSNNGITIGVRSTDNPSSGTYNSDGVFYYANTGAIYVDGSVTDTEASFGVNDIIGIALNVDDDEVSFYKNNTLQITKSLPQSGKTWHPQFGEGTSSGNNSFNANFGQDSSFAGNETPQGNTDDNGQGDFYYAPPSGGFLALTTGNLPAPSITAPDEYFNTILYTGDGNTRSLTGVGFQPDWVWVKNRNSTFYHLRTDVVRGADNALDQTTSAEVNQPATGYMSSFDSDGFTVTSGSSNINNYNGSGYTYAAWNWKAGGTAVSNTDGSITSQVSANQDAGFSVVSYTGNGSSSPYPSIGHGLTSTPEIIFCKTRDASASWIVYHTLVDGSLDYLNLDTTSANNNAAPSLPTSSIFYAGGDANRSGEDTIAYCFHSVPQYSKCGVYTGNGSTDGTFVHCGFRPAWIMVKRTDSTSNWLILDNKREGYNPDQDGLDANGSGAEGTAEQSDFLSNGFKVRNNSSGSNASGGTFIFLAFAEAPFKNANAR